MDCPSKQTPPPSISPAKVEQDQVLTKIALASKAHWGYDQAFMDLCQEELTITKTFLSEPDNRVFIANCPLNQLVLGFYALTPLADQPLEAELEALFVLPSQIGSGIGSRLFRHCCSEARGLGYQKLIIQSDPFAENFYQKMGAVTVAQKPSESIPGRTLPLMEYAL